MWTGVYWCGRHGGHGCLSQGLGRSTSSGTTVASPPPPPPPRPTTSISTITSNTAQAQPPPEQPHQLALQECLGQGWEGIRRRRPRGDTSRSLSHRGHKATCRGTALCAQPAVRATLHVRPRQPCNGKYGNIYIYTVPPRQGKNYLPSRPAEEPHIYRPVARGDKKCVPPHPVVKICPVEFYRPASSHFYASPRPAPPT